MQLRCHVDMSRDLTEALSGQHAKVVRDFARDPPVFRLPSQIAKQSCELFEAACEQASVRDVNDGHQELHSVGDRGHARRSASRSLESTALITLANVTRFPR